MKSTLALLEAFWAGKKMPGKKWENRSSISYRPSFCRFFLTALLLAPLAALHAAEPVAAAGPQWSAATVEAELSRYETVLREFGVKDPLRWARAWVGPQTNWASPQVQNTWNQRIHYWRLVLLDDDPAAWREWLTPDHPSLSFRRDQLESGGQRARQAWAAQMAGKPRLLDYVRDQALRMTLFETEGGGVYRPDGPFVSDRAEALLAGKLYWLDLPAQVGETDYGWARASSGCWHMIYLALAYFHQRDDKWIEEFQNEVVALVAGHEVGEAHYTVSSRLRFLMPTYLVMKDSPAMSARFHGIVSRMIWADANYLHRLGSSAYKDNFLCQSGLALYLAAEVFPEFRDSKLWLERLWPNLVDGYGRELLADGCHFHRSFSYHMSFVQRGLSIMAVARMLGRSEGVPEAFKMMVAGAVGAFARVSTPIRSTPGINDDWTVNNEYRATLRLAADLFDRADWRWLATDGREGEPPGELSALLPAAGLIAMRSDWSKNARWLLFNVSPDGGHHHPDTLSIRVWASGRKLLIEPFTGDYTFERELYGRSWWHSCPTFGARQLPRNPAPKVLHYETAEDMTYAVGQIEVPGPDGGLPAKLRRHVFFVDRSWWLLWDEFSRLPRGQTVWENFHFATQELDVADDGLGVRTRFPRGGNLLMLVGRPGWSLRKEETRTWPSYGRETIPTTTLHYQGDAAVAGGGFAALLVPLDGQDVPPGTCFDRAQLLADGRAQLVVRVAGKRRELTTRVTDAE